MSLFATISHLFGKAEAATDTVASDIKAGLKTVDNFVGVILGQAGIVGDIIEAVDPPLGTEVVAGVAALTALRGTVHAVANEAGPDLAALGKQVLQLGNMALTLGAKVAPFYDVAAKEAGAVDTAAVAAVKALPAIPASV